MSAGPQVSVDPAFDDLGLQPRHHPYPILASKILHMSKLLVRRTSLIRWRSPLRWSMTCESPPKSVPADEFIENRFDLYFRRVYTFLPIFHRPTFYSTFVDAASHAKYCDLSTESYCPLVRYHVTICPIFYLTLFQSHPRPQ